MGLSECKGENVAGLEACSSSQFESQFETVTRLIPLTWVATIALSLAAVAGCGGGSGNSGSGGGNPPATPTITSVAVSCPSLTVPTGQTTQCSATVSGTGSYSSAVTWSVSGAASGNATVGTISTSGLYTAPNTVPIPYTVSVTATSTADSTKSATASVIVAGTIATVTQQIVAAAGGTITLPDGSSVAIAAGALPGDQSVTLSEVSFLPQQPPNAAITGVGPALELTFSTPVLPPASSVSPARRTNGGFPATAGSTVPTAFSFSINVAKNNVSALNGSVSFVDFVDSSNNNLYAGTSGNYDSTVPIVNASIDSDAWTALKSWSNKISGIAVGTFNFAVSEGTVAWKAITAPHQLNLTINKADASQDSWTDYSSCPSGRTLLVVHGMNDYVEQGFTTGTGKNQRLIQPIIQAGDYSNVLGFDYDWTQGIDASGAQLATFLDRVISQCTGISLDIEAHSEGVPVSLAALGTLMQTHPNELNAIKHVVALGGPIMGTPMANDARGIATILANAGTLTLPAGIVLSSLSDLLSRPFTSDLKVSTPQQRDTLNSIRTSLSGLSIKGQPEIFVVAGNNQEASTSGLGFAMFWCGELMTMEGFPASDGFIPLTSALALQPGVNPGSELQVHPLPPFPTNHVGLVGDSRIVTAVGQQVNNAFVPPSLTLSASPACSDNDDFVCQAAPGTVFALGGIGYSTAAANQGYELDEFGNIFEHDFLAPNGSIGSGTWQDPTACSATAVSVMFFAQDAVTQLASNSITAETTTGACVAPPVVTISPTTAQIPVNGVQQFTALVSDTTNTAVSWSVNGVSGGNATVGTVSGTGFYSAPATVPNPATVIVTVTSEADSAVTASATVTIGPYAVKDIYSFSSLGDGAAPSAPLIQATDTYFYSTAQVGGTYGYGTVFRVDSSGNIKTLHDFTELDGANPNGPVIQASNQALYGTTDFGGIYNKGTVFTIDPTSGTFTSLYSFSGGSDGGDVPDGLIEANGYLYGTTFEGGANNSGTVFKMSLSGQITTLYSFTGGSDGNGPAGLILGSDGLFYGGTQNGGDASCSDGPGTGCGTLFKIDASGNLQVLHTFTGQDGAQIDETLFQSPVDHYFYGTALFGGNPACTVSTYSGCGTIFRIDSSGNFTLLHSFTGGVEGGVPFSSLIQASDGDFYGTAAAGGDPSCSVIASGENFPTYNGCGTVFKMDSSGNLNALYSFKGSPTDGSNPFAALLVGSDGYFYGTTRWGGTAVSCPYTSNGGCGTFYRVAGPGGPLPQISKPRLLGAAIPFGSLQPDKNPHTEPPSPRLGSSGKPLQGDSVPLTGLKKPE